MTEGEEHGGSQSTIHTRNAVVVHQLPQRKVICLFAALFWADPEDRISLPPEEGISRLGTERAGSNHCCPGALPDVSGTPLGRSPTSSFVTPRDQ